MTSAPAASVLPSEPKECDVCGEALGAMDEFVSFVIVTDATPRGLRRTRGGGFIENEWRLDAVCSKCHDKFETWLFGSRLGENDDEPVDDRVELERRTLPAPPPVDCQPSDSETPNPDSDCFTGFDAELAPLASLPPNRS